MYSRSMQSAGTWLLVVGATVSFLVAQPAVAADEAIFGYWKSIDEDTGKTQSVFRLWEDKGKLVGKVLKRYPKPGETLATVCTKCSGSAKDKPIDGMIFLWGLTPSKDDPKKWVDGKVLNPRDGKTYNVELTLSEDHKTISCYGYINLLVKVGGTNVWQRATVEESK